MANAIPLLEGTDASGGYLVSEQYGETLQNTILRRSAVWDLSRVQRVVGRRQKYAVYAGRPTAAFVAEAAEKPVTGAEYTELTVNVKKIATNVIYTEELLEDAREDPSVLVSADVEAAFMDLIDAHALGMAAGTAIVGQFDSELTATTSTVELGATNDAFAIAVSSALATIEGNGGTPNGIVAAYDVRAHLRDARGTGDNAEVPIYTPGYTANAPETLYGVPIRYTSNLDALPAGAGKVAAVVGDFTHAIGVVRRDISVRMSDQATLNVSGTLHHLWQQNKTAAQWEMRVGFAAHDLNRMFVAITNAA
jgi:HK97 family phage major capsid protein